MILDKGNLSFYGDCTVSLSQHGVTMVVVIPCYNEENRLGIEEYQQIIDQYKDIAILFVNDGSTDKTSHVLKDMVEKNDRVFCLDRQNNKGKAETVREGVLYAFSNLETQTVAFYDADLATPFSDLVKMRDCLLEDEKCMVVGCRFKRLGGAVYRRYIRFFLGRIFATCAANVLHLPVYDTQCGAKVFHRDVVSTMFNESFVSKWLFDIELFARIVIEHGYDMAIDKIVEYPLSAWTDVGGSKLKFKDVVKQPYNLFLINNHYKKKLKVKRYVK